MAARKTPKRSRGTRAQLTRERIVEEALALVDEAGSEGFRVRGLAERLGVTPMAVYNHIDGRDALVRALFEHVVQTYAPTGHDTEGAGPFLRESFLRIGRAMREHPGVVALVSEVLALALGEVSMEIMERALVAGRADGIDDEALVSAFYRAMSFTLGFHALDRATRPHRADGDAATAERAYAEGLRFAAGARFPAVAEAADALSRAFRDDAFAAGLDAILAPLGA